MTTEIIPHSPPQAEPTPAEAAFLASLANCPEETLFEYEAGGAFPGSVFHLVHCEAFAELAREFGPEATEEKAKALLHHALRSRGLELRPVMMWAERDEHNPYSALQAQRDELLKALKTLKAVAADASYLIGDGSYCPIDDPALWRKQVVERLDRAYLDANRLVAQVEREASQ